MEDNAQILEYLTKALEVELPFVVYSLPNSSMIRGVFQTDDTLYQLDDYTSEGIVLCSFDSSQKIIIPFDKSRVVEFKWHTQKVENTSDFSSVYSDKEREDFESKVNQAVQIIRDSDIDKIVLSRPKNIKNLSQKPLQDVVTKLFSMYTNTFNYCFFHPKIGLWLGATPEKLLSIKNNVLQTMSYAGTQKYRGTEEVSWGNKEQEEQKFVTQFIVDSLESCSSKIRCSEPYTSRAGSLLHIRSDIEALLSELFNLEKIITQLHPTPAVCGLPKQEAMQKIKELEQYDRKFYAGYIGELNFENQTNLYVNIRCAELQGTDLTLYVGCGITAQSIAEDEFVETENKSSTINAIFQ
ncbi:MAG: chorismate-binding protein [Bacteroidota bacterium]|nr:chorismate-binding protein [Bacteroidota bacterium]